MDQDDVALVGGSAARRDASLKRRGQPALRRPRVGAAPVLPSSQAQLSCHSRPTSAGGRGGRSPPSRAAAAPPSSPAARRPDEPDPVSSPQSRGAPQSPGDRRAHVFPPAGAPSRPPSPGGGSA